MTRKFSIIAFLFLLQMKKGSQEKKILATLPNVQAIRVFWQIREESRTILSLKIFGGEFRYNRIEFESSEPKLT